MTRRDRRGWCPGTADRAPHLTDKLGKPRDGVTRCRDCQTATQEPR